jgi:hypothetical protein
MGLNGIGFNQNFIGNYRIPQVPTVSVDEVRKQDEQLKQAQKEQFYSPASPQSSPSVPRNDAALEDISLTFNKSDDFGYIGKDSDIYSLDVENAISDMKKDDVLRQYQFFVGSSASGAIVDNSDGVVIPKL